MSEEVIHESWFSRLGGAFKGILTGVVIFVAAFPLLWWNEGRAVKTARALKEGAAAVQETDSDSVDQADDGKFVHLTGEATTDEILEDSDFGVAVSAIRLERTVEMYQWTEDVESTTRKKLGGGTETVKEYSYRKAWSEQAIDSGSFHDAGHDNPGELPIEGFVKTASDVRLGEYRLPDSLIGSIRGSEALPVSLPDVPARWQSVLRLHGSNGFYLPASRLPVQPPTAAGAEAAGDPSASPQDALVSKVGTDQPAVATPQIGDVRITFTVTRPTTVSVMSKQHGNTFTPFRTSNGKELNMLAMGNVPASEMISRAEAENTLWTWGLRIAGFMMMAVGIGLVLRPLSVFADVLPIAGDLVGVGTGLISFVISAALSLGTISLAWLFYRPLVGLPLLLAGIGLVAGLIHFLRKSRAARTTQTPGDKASLADSGRTDESSAPDDVDEAISV